MTGTIVGIILIIFGVINIYLSVRIKEKTAIVKGINLDTPKVMIVSKNKIRWEDSNGKGFEIALTELEGETK